MGSSSSLAPLKSAIFDREERKQHYQAHIRGLNAYERHNKFLNDYVKYYGKQTPSGMCLPETLPVKTDLDALREGYRFIRTEEDDLDTSWEQRLVKRYYDKLFKEYCIADMSKYKTGKIGLRWRTEKEVTSGKGQFICGNKHCDERDGLASYEVNFSYIEAGENKQALVKLVTCQRCAEKLQYRRNLEKERIGIREKEEYESKRVRTQSDDEMDDKHKKRPKHEMSEDREKGRSRLQRRRSTEGDTSGDEFERSKEPNAKGKPDSSSGADHGNGDDENFDEYLQGMFP